VSDESDEDDSDLPATSRACRARGLWRSTVDTTHADNRAALRERRPLADQSDKRVHGKLNGEVVRHARHQARHPCKDATRMSRLSRVSDDFSTHQMTDLTQPNSYHSENFSPGPNLTHDLTQYLTGAENKFRDALNC